MRRRNFIGRMLACLAGWLGWKSASPPAKSHFIKCSNGSILAGPKWIGKELLPVDCGIPHVFRVRMDDWVCDTDLDGVLFGIEETEE